MAIQILELNYSEKEIFLAGINQNGGRFAKLLWKELEAKREGFATLLKIKLDPAKPLNDEPSVDVDPSKLKNKVIILVDDVANTGRTLHFALKPFMGIIPKKIQVAVLLDRTHKMFPIQADFVGLALATTWQQNIEVSLKGKKYEVHLD